MKEELGTASVYSMGVAERLTGLTGRQIRYWEQHGLLAPSRTQGRQRMYSEADIQKLKEIKRLMTDGMTMERVKTHFANKETRRIRAAAEMSPALNRDRFPRVGSLYNGSNRAELMRMIERNSGK